MTGLAKKCWERFESHPTYFFYVALYVSLFIWHVMSVCAVLDKISLSASFPKDLLITRERESVSHVIDLDSLHGLLAALFADI